MFTIGFWASHYCYRGTSDAMYHYALFNETLLGNKSILFQRIPPLYPELTVKGSFLRCLKRFRIVLYTDVDELEEKCKLYNVDAMYFILGGNDESNCTTIRNNCPHYMPRFVHCVFSYKLNAKVEEWMKWTIFAGVSNQVASLHVNHMVIVDDTQEDLRKTLQIPSNAVVFGRHGGADCFDPEYVVDAIIELAQATYHNQQQPVYFIFMPMPYTFYARVHELPSTIIFLPVTTSKNYVRLFINTCDAMIHAKSIGESFGLACMEFSACNKPVLTHKCVHDCNLNKHLDNLGDKAWLYHDKESCLQQMKNLIQRRDEVKDQNWDVTACFKPEIVMNEFNEVFVSQIPRLQHMSNLDQTVKK